MALWQRCTPLHKMTKEDVARLMQGPSGKEKTWDGVLRQKRDALCTSFRTKLGADPTIATALTRLLQDWVIHHTVTAATDVTAAASMLDAAPPPLTPTNVHASLARYDTCCTDGHILRVTHRHTPLCPALNPLPYRVITVTESGTEESAVTLLRQVQDAVNPLWKAWLLTPRHRGERVGNEIVQQGDLPDVSTVADVSDLALRTAWVVTLHTKYAVGVEAVNLAAEGDVVGSPAAHATAGPGAVALSRLFDGVRIAIENLVARVHRTRPGEVKCLALSSGRSSSAASAPSIATPAHATASTAVPATADGAAADHIASSDEV